MRDEEETKRLRARERQQIATNTICRALAVLHNGEPKRARALLKAAAALLAA